MKEQSERVSRLIDFAPHTFCIFDSKMNLIYVNRTGVKLWGPDKLEKNDLVGKNILELLPELKEIGRYDKYLNVIKTGIPFTAEEVAVLPRYGEKYVNVMAIKIGDCLGIIISDVTERKKAEEALEESEKRYRLLVESMNEGLIRIDENGKVTYLNDRFLEAVGYERDEIVGLHLSNLFGGKYWKLFKEQQSRRKKGEGGAYEATITRKDGSEIHVFVSATPVFDEEGSFRGSISVITDITNLRLAEQELKKSREELRSLSLHLQSIREDERKHLSQEIHDELGQLLTALKMDLSWLSQRLPKGHQEQKLLLEKTKSMSELLNMTMKSVQRISSELRPGLLDDLGLVPAMEWQAQEFEKRAKIRCEVSLDSEEIDLDQNLSTALFRVFQEALTNVARHAQATKVKVNFRERNGKLTLKIKDNGKGITQDEVHASDSLGIVGMRERLSPWQGKIEITGTRDRGTTLTVTVPLKRKSASK